MLRVLGWLVVLAYLYFWVQFWFAFLGFANANTFLLITAFVVAVFWFGGRSDDNDPR